MKLHSKAFGVYYWDTFDEVTLVLNEFDTISDAEQYVEKAYQGRIGPDGADVVEIVDSRGSIVRRYKVR